MQRLSLNSHLKASEFLIGPLKYFDGNSCLLRKAPGRKTHHIRQFEEVYGMRTIMTIVKADYCFMSQLLLNILSNVTLHPHPSLLVHLKHTFVTHPTKISRFQKLPRHPQRTRLATLPPPPPPRKENSERAPWYNVTTDATSKLCCGFELVPRHHLNACGISIFACDKVRPIHV